MVRVYRVIYETTLNLYIEIYHEAVVSSLRVLGFRVIGFGILTVWIRPAARVTPRTPPRRAQRPALRRARSTFPAARNRGGKNQTHVDMITRVFTAYEKPKPVIQILYKTRV